MNLNDIYFKYILHIKIYLKNHEVTYLRFEYSVMFILLQSLLNHAKFLLNLAHSGSLGPYFIAESQNTLMCLYPNLLLLYVQLPDGEIS